MNNTVTNPLCAEILLGLDCDHIAIMDDSGAQVGCGKRALTREDRVELVANPGHLECDWCEPGSGPARFLTAEYGWRDYACSAHAERFFRSARLRALRRNYRRSATTERTMFKLREIMSTPTGVTVDEWQHFANGVELHKAVNRFTAGGVFVDDCASAARQFRRYGNARFVFRASWEDARTTRMRLIIQVVSR